jgi:hypothetical protein
LGPVVVNYMHDTRLEANVPFDQIYAPIFMVLAGMMVVGFIANLLVTPVAAKYTMNDAELAAERQLAHEKAAPAKVTKAKAVSATAGTSYTVAIAWALVLVPISYGVWSTVQKAWILFH